MSTIFATFIILVMKFFHVLVLVRNFRNFQCFSMFPISAPFLITHFRVQVGESCDGNFDHFHDQIIQIPNEALCCVRMQILILAVIPLINFTQFFLQAQQHEPNFSFLMLTLWKKRVAFLFQKVIHRFLCCLNLDGILILYLKQH